MRKLKITETTLWQEGCVRVCLQTLKRNELRMFLKCKITVCYYSNILFFPNEGKNELKDKRFSSRSQTLLRAHLFKQQVVVLGLLGCLDSAVHLCLKTCTVLQGDSHLV